MRLYRYELVETLLNAGIPLSKADIMRPFLEKYGHRLTSRSHLAEFMPLILRKEKDTVKAEIAANDDFPVIFDGSTRLGEALAIVVRFIYQWSVQQRLVKLEVLARKPECRTTCTAFNPISAWLLNMVLNPTIFWQQ
jgi:hypothetical protein